MYRIPKLPVLALAAIASLAACTDAGDPLTAPIGRTVASMQAPDVQRVLVVFAARDIPAGFAESIGRMGGTVDWVREPIGVAMVSGLGDEAVAGLSRAPGVVEVRRVRPVR
ncbi:MAG TPA: hypothetical protein VF625_12965 [Longimicrobium sp.]|jgi:hypothetical protein